MRTSNAPRKLSDTQRDVLVKLADGWELMVGGGQFASRVLQQDGAGRGGRTKTITSPTMTVLYRAGYLERIGAERSGPGLSNVYTISEAGHEALGHES